MCRAPDPRSGTSRSRRPLFWPTRRGAYPSGEPHTHTHTHTVCCCSVCRGTTNFLRQPLAPPVGSLPCDPALKRTRHTHTLFRDTLGQQIHPSRRIRMQHPRAAPRLKPSSSTWRQAAVAEASRNLPPGTPQTAWPKATTRTSRGLPGGVRQGHERPLLLQPPRAYLNLKPRLPSWHGGGNFQAAWRAASSAASTA